MIRKELLSIFLFVAMIAGLFLITNPSTRAPELDSLPPPDYDSGLINLPKATAVVIGLIIDHVNPTTTTLTHSLGTYNILVQVLAIDSTGRYVSIPSSVYPSTLIGGGLWGQTRWFLTSQNQIMLENWD